LSLITRQRPPLLLLNASETSGCGSGRQTSHLASIKAWSLQSCVTRTDPYTMLPIAGQYWEI
jgi:hypothetical protein